MFLPSEIPMHKLVPLLFLAILGCRDKDRSPIDTGTVPTDDTGTEDTGTEDTDTDQPEVDADGDGSSEDVDCDDSRSDIHPGADEVCDSADNDCDGEIDEDATDASTWYEDLDQDGYGDAFSSVNTCALPVGFVSNSDDCDPLDPSAHPGGVEICDGVDNDCDGLVDGPDTLDAVEWYADSDGDGYGDAASTTMSCNLPDSGYVADDTDCDDTEAAVNPAATEVCNGSDDDCDTFVDDSDPNVAGQATWYPDVDADGYGDARFGTAACDPPSGHVSDATDCSDLDGTAYPGANEVCDGDDENCDGVIDESSAVDATTWFADSDGDGFGDASTGAAACNQPSGWVDDSSDCDDADAAVNPNAVEICDALDTDEDCNGAADDADAGVTDATPHFPDGDSDGFGDASDAGTGYCDPPSGVTTDATDCNDSNNAIFPGAAETCDGVDEDCDGSADAGIPGLDATCATTDCEAVLTADPSAPDGRYWLDTGSGPFETECDMTSDGGAWTLLGTVANDGNRTWDNLAVFTDTTTLGDISTWNGSDYKNPAWEALVGDDLLVRTDEYKVAWTGLLGSASFADWITAEYDATQCSTTFLGGTPDYYSGLTSAQVNLFDVTVRGLDDNANNCFPGSNENALISFTFSSCCWNNGLGNTPGGYATWQTYDLSMLRVNNLVGSNCSTGYPCNPAGRVHDNGSNCYDASCKAAYASVWVR